MARAYGKGVVGTVGIKDCIGVIGDPLGAGAMIGRPRGAAGVEGPARGAAAGLGAGAEAVVAGVGTGNKTGMGIRGLDGPATSGDGVEGGVLAELMSLWSHHRSANTHYGFASV